MTRRWARALLCVSFLSPTLASSAAADEAAPLPAKDVRWSATLGGVVDVGSLPRASTGLALGFDVRRGALAARGLTSVFAPVRESGTGASVGLLDLMGMVCALAPVSAWFDAGACGGGGAGLLRAERSDGAKRLRIGFADGLKAFARQIKGERPNPDNLQTLVDFIANETAYQRSMR